MPGEPVGHAFLEATGFAYHSTVWDLDLPPDRPVGAPEWPAGLVARPFGGTDDVETWVSVFNAAFADHATPLQLDPAFIAAGLADPDNDDGDVILVEEAATGELVGFCATDPSGATASSPTTARSGPSASGRTGRVEESGGSSSGPASSACGRSASRTSASRSTAGTRARWGYTSRRASSGAGRGTAGRDRRLGPTRTLSAPRQPRSRPPGPPAAPPTCPGSSPHRRAAPAGRTAGRDVYLVLRHLL